jgi:Na+/proline symporter/signal transduction histidine kinase
MRALVYSLALAVYCSSWTFFGAISQSVSGAWAFLPIYLGPILLFVFAGGFMRKLLVTGERLKVTSLADFIGSRYGKSQRLAALVTLVAVAGSLPYIALQLRAVTMAWEIISSSTDTTAALLDTAFVAAVLMAFFAVIFGTGHLEGRERNRGLLAAIAMESLVKLVAFAAVAGLGAWLIWQALTVPGANDSIATAAAAATNSGPSFAELMGPWRNNPININFITQTLLAMAAIICLPRQFHMAVVEYRDERDWRMARWVLPTYLFLFFILIVPIVVAGQMSFSGSNIPAESYVLNLPLFLGREDLALLAFIGGLSAATGMVVVAAVALAVMISNELVAPLWLRITRASPGNVVALGAHLRLIRSMSIFAVLFLAWGVHRLLIDDRGLASIGLLSFSAAAQLAPALVAALYWQRGHKNGVLVGLLAGYSLWAYCLLLPAVLPEQSTLLRQGLLDISWLRPQALFGVNSLDSLSHGVFWSLLFNIGLFILISLRSQANEDDERQAQAFVNDYPVASAGQGEFELTTLTMAQVHSVLSPFVSEDRLAKLWQAFEQRSEQRLLNDDLAPLFCVQESESVLSGIVGSATARRLIDLVRQGGALRLGDIAKLMDGTSQQLQFSQELLQTTVETVSQGISVVDAELCLIAWNKKYVELFSYPKNLLYVGCPIEKLYHYNATQGLYGTADNLNQEVAKRVQQLRSGGDHRFERQLPNNIFIEVHGKPMPGGGFVTTYTDISDYRAAVNTLEETRLHLEERVSQRTEDLSATNQELEAENRRRGEVENKLRELHASKTRFMAETSHDLLQPINAARLLIAAVEHKISLADWQGLVADVVNIDSALSNAEQLINALREISRLDSGELRANCKNFQVSELLGPLVSEFEVMTAERGLRFCHPECHAWVYSDLHLLRRIVQNFLSNALNYTSRGRVLLGCRRRANHLVIEVWDTGVGIADANQLRVFDEFVRLSPGERASDNGLGLGLAIAKRSAKLLGHEIALRSWPGRGSVFSIKVSLGKPGPVAAKKIDTTGVSSDLAGAGILCIDNEPAILQGMYSLLTSWGCDVVVASSAAEAMTRWQKNNPPDLVIVDYHLDNNATGFEALDLTSERWGPLPALVISADNSELVREGAKDKAYHYLSKPVKPAALRSLLRRLLRSRVLNQ